MKITLNNKFILGIIFVLLCLILILQYKSCKNQKIINKRTNISTLDSFVNKRQFIVDSLKVEVLKRDSLLLISSSNLDTTINNVTTIIRNYYSVDDTIMKLITCDSLVIACSKLSVKCSQNDSLHQVQEKILKLNVRILQTIVDTLKVEYSALDYKYMKEIRNKKRWRNSTLIASGLAIIFGFLK